MTSTIDKVLNRLTTKHGTYRQVSRSEVPSTIRFDVLQHDQGQTVERAWGTRSRAEAGVGERYHRIIDRSEMPTSPERERYFVRERKLSVKKNLPTKSQIESYALAGTVEGREAATVSSDGRKVTYRHVWSEKTSDSVFRPLSRAVRDWARELANHNGSQVTVWSKDGYRLEVMEPDER